MADGGDAPAPAPADRSRAWPGAVFAACLLLTIAATATALVLYRDSEEQLLEQQTREAASVVTSAISGIENAILNAAIVAETTDGDPVVFRPLAERMMESNSFVAMTLLGPDGTALVEVGDAGETESATLTPEQAAALTARARESAGSVLVEQVGSAGDRRLAYVATSAADGTGFAIYAETPLPADRTGVGRSDGPFSDIDYAIYLGRQADDDALLYSSADSVPIAGTTTSATLEFGDRGLLFVAAAATPLAGRFAQAAPWMLAVGGLLIAGLAAGITRSVIRRRQRAEQLAAEISDLYERQRTGIETLRQSLLPRHLVEPPGVSITTGYWPADADNEISGDFYDAFSVDDRRWALVIGDVCGKGAEAAALTALTRHTVRAAARQLRDPTEVLRWTHEAIAASGSATYVTVCFAFLELSDDGTATLELALGGHPRPARWHDGSIDMIGTPGTLLGLIAPHHRSTTHVLEPGDVVIMYTDGLTDAADAPLSAEALSGVFAAVLAQHELPQAAEAIRAEVQRRRPSASSDDSAVLLIGLDRAAAPMRAGPAHDPSAPPPVAQLTMSTPHPPH